MSANRVSDADDYLWNNTPQETFTEAQYAREIADAAHWVVDLIQDYPSDWIPEIVDPEDVDELEYISSLNDLNDPIASHGACIMVSEAIIEYVESKDSHVEPPFEMKVVQGLYETNALFNCHYALLVRMQEGSAPVMIDLTFAQFDEDEVFPLIASPSVWGKKLNDISAVLVEKSFENSENNFDEDDEEIFDEDEDEKFYG